MPFRSRSFREHSLRVTVLSGIVGEAEILDEYARILDSPDFDPGHRELVDLGGVERIDIGTAGIGKVVSMARPLDQAGIAHRLAIVAPTDASYGLSRMYQLMRHESPGETEIFRDLEAACRWLGLDSLLAQRLVNELDA